MLKNKELDISQLCFFSSLFFFIPVLSAKFVVNKQVGNEENLTTLLSSKDRSKQKRIKLVL